MVERITIGQQPMGNFYSGYMAKQQQHISQDGGVQRDLPAAHGHLPHHVRLALYCMSKK